MHTVDNTQNRFLYNLWFMEVISGSFYSGLSGLQLPIPQYRFPPAFEHASRLTYYASLFNSIEINSSFYKIPQSETVSRWAASVPPYFKFSFKVWKDITHIKGLHFKEDDIARFMNSVNSVQDKKGCLLIQFPPSISKEYLMQLDKLLSCIRKKDDMNWQIAVEFRHPSWYHDSTYKLLNIFEAALVVQDMPKSATPKVLHQSEFMFIRFHGPTGNYNSGYTEDFLGAYAANISDWLKEGKDVYLYFNNTMGDAYNNLITMNKYLNTRHVAEKLTP